MLRHASRFGIARPMSMQSPVLKKLEFRTMVSEIRIRDVFHFADGRTVLVGIPSDPAPNLLRPSAELMIDGRCVAALRLDNVEIPRRVRHASHRLVAVATQDVVEWDTEFARTHGCVLKFTE
jgi:hypothetical protein